MLIYCLNMFHLTVSPHRKGVKILSRLAVDLLLTLKQNESYLSQGAVSPITPLHSEVLSWRGRRAWRRCARNSSHLTAFFVSHSRIRVCLWEPTAYVSLVGRAHQNLCIHQCLAQRPAGKNCKSRWLNLPRCSYLKHKIKRGPSKKHAILFCFIVLHVLVAQSCLTLCDPMDCSPPGSPVHGIFQARIL